MATVRSLPRCPSQAARDTRITQQKRALCPTAGSPGLGGSTFHAPVCLAADTLKGANEQSEPPLGEELCPGGLCHIPSQSQLGCLCLTLKLYRRVTEGTERRGNLLQEPSSPASTHTPTKPFLPRQSSFFQTLPLCLTGKFKIAKTSAHRIYTVHTAPCI